MLRAGSGRARRAVKIFRRIEAPAMAMALAGGLMAGLSGGAWAAESERRAGALQLAPDSRGVVAGWMGAGPKSDLLAEEEAKLRITLPLRKPKDPIAYDPLSGSGYTAMGDVTVEMNWGWRGDGVALSMRPGGTQYQFGGRLDLGDKALTLGFSVPF